MYLLDNLTNLTNLRINDVLVKLPENISDKLKKQSEKNNQLLF